MVDRVDLLRLTDKLGSLDRPSTIAVDARQDSLAPTFPDSALPTRRHKKSGKTCEALSRAGATKTVTHPRSISARTYELESCPCGGRRQIVNGVPDGLWIDINRALDDPNWCTRERATTTSPEGR